MLIESLFLASAILHCVNEMHAMECELVSEIFILCIFFSQKICAAAV